MKYSISIFALSLTLGISLSGWSSEKSHSEDKSHVDEAKTTSKTGRKKRATICAECGRPESSCECGHAEGAKEDKPDSTQTTHKPGDGHKH